MKKKLLISGVGGAAFSYILKELNYKYDIYGIDSNPIIKKLYPKNKIFIVPKVLDENFEQVIKKIIIENKIDFYISNIDEEIVKAIKISEETNIKHLSPTKEFVKLCLDKYSLMHSLKENKLSYIETYIANEYNFDLEFPIFLKPINGRGSRGIKKISSKEEFEAYFLLEGYTKEEVLVQPYIDGDEYTVSVIVNNKNKLISIVPKIVFEKDGITKYAKSIHNEYICEICKQIVNIYKPMGSFNVQLKLKENKIFIFEINPRFSTTIVLTMASGIDEIDLSIENYNSNDVEYISDFEEKILIRRWENIIL